MKFDERKDVKKYLEIVGSGGDRASLNYKIVDEMSSITLFVQDKESAYKNWIAGNPESKENLKWIAVKKAEYDAKTGSWSLFMSMDNGKTWYNSNG